jgi:hypothetical protein
MSEKDKKKKPAAPAEEASAKAAEDRGDKKAAEKKPARKKASERTPETPKSADKKPAVKRAATAKKKTVTLVALNKEAVFPGSSKAATASAKPEKGPTGPVAEVPPMVAADAVIDGPELSPLARKLADAELPALPRENRARLQMQSPTRIYFYWSIKNNPFKILNRAFSGASVGYTLVVKLVNHSRGTEEIHPIEAEGNWWFQAEPDSLYRAEVGFYAPNRPYVRIIFSNHLRTPRRSPSWRTDYTPRFTVSAPEFAEVLDNSGYQRDAFEVALAGDDRIAADTAAEGAFKRLLGDRWQSDDGIDGDELRFVLLALASGYSLDELKGQISEALFAKLSALGARFSAEQALAALGEFFDVETGEIEEVEEIGPAVFGLSAINFPKRVRTRTVPKKLLNRLSRFDTVSSSR